MKGEEARTLLGFPPNSHLTLQQIKDAYRRKVLESHPDLFPVNEKAQAEARFKQISEAYSCLRAGTRHGYPTGASSVRVVRNGAPNVYGRSNQRMVKAPFLLLILGTVALAGVNATRAYQRQKQAYPSYNPFLP